ncbi:hypothetical protein TcCL_Unassigned02740 [Trypanosoma cruzi]|nr:hypothetical protein TcCL_Unassigned02740 [Trypanosoma cruzi]
MRPPGVARGPSGHWDCAECGIPRGYLHVLFYFFIHPSQASTRRLSQRLRRDPLRISGSFCVAAAGLVCPARQTRWTEVGCVIGKTMVTAECVAYVAIWRVCGDPCGWCDGASFTCGERSDAPRWCTRCVWRFLLLLVCECLFFAFAGTPQRAVSADSRALRGGAPHDF